MNALIRYIRVEDVNAFRIRIGFHAAVNSLNAFTIHMCALYTAYTTKRVCYENLDKMGVLSMCRH
jgi:hypothetical protein